MGWLGQWETQSWGSPLEGGGEEGLNEGRQLEWRKLGRRWDLGTAWIMGLAGEEEDGSKNNSSLIF